MASAESSCFRTARSTRIREPKQHGWPPKTFPHSGVMPWRTGGAHQDQTGRGRAGSNGTSHTVAGEDSLAAIAQPGPVLLETLLNCHIVAQLVTTKPLCIPFARRLLLRRSHVALAQGRSHSRQNDSRGKDELSHQGTLSYVGQTLCYGCKFPWSAASAALYSGMQAFFVVVKSPRASASGCALLRDRATAPPAEAKPCSILVGPIGVKRPAACWR